MAATVIVVARPSLTRFYSSSTSRCRRLYSLQHGAIHDSCRRYHSITVETKVPNVR